MFIIMAVIICAKEVKIFFRIVACCELFCFVLNSKPIFLSLF